MNKEWGLQSAILDSASDRPHRPTRTAIAVPPRMLGMVMRSPNKHLRQVRTGRGRQRRRRHLRPAWHWARCPRAILQRLDFAHKRSLTAPAHRRAVARYGLGAAVCTAPPPPAALAMRVLYARRDCSLLLLANDRITILTGCISGPQGSRSADACEIAARVTRSIPASFSTRSGSTLRPRRPWLRPLPLSYDYFNLINNEARHGHRGYLRKRAAPQRRPYRRQALARDAFSLIDSWFSRSQSCPEPPPPPGR